MTKFGLFVKNSKLLGFNPALFHLDISTLSIDYTKGFLFGRNALDPHFLHLTFPALTFAESALILLEHDLHTYTLVYNLAIASGKSFFTIPL